MKRIQIFTTAQQGEAVFLLFKIPHGKFTKSKTQIANCLHGNSGLQYVYVVEKHYQKTSTTA